MRSLPGLLQKQWPIPVCMVVSAFFVYFPITDADIFWHLAAGREMAARHGFIYTDPFAYTLASPRWIDLHWIFQLLLYGLFCLGSYKAILGFKLAVAGAIAALLCLTHRTPRYQAIAAFLTIILFYAMRYLLCVRPILITMFCMTLFVFLFERSRRTGKTVALWWCVPLQIVWTNSQGLYLLGLFIIAAYFIENAVPWLRKHAAFPKDKALLLAASAAACLVNPYGAYGLLLPFNLFSRIAPHAGNIFSLTIPENVPLFSLTGYDTVYRTVSISIALFAALLFLLNRRNVRASHLILFAGFGCLAASAVRNVPLFFIIAAPIIAGNIADLWQVGRFRRFTGASGHLISYAALVGALLTSGILVSRHASVVSLYPPNRAISPFRFPEQAVDYLIAHPVSGNMFNDMRYGGYLIWRLFPEKKVFIDTRLVIRSPEFFAEYLTISEHPEIFDAVAEKFGITQVILPCGLYSLHGALIRHLYRSDKWRLAFTNGASVLFIRSDLAGDRNLDLSNKTTEHEIEANISAQWAQAPKIKQEAQVYFAGLLDLLR